ncbi:class A beta-lactamase-related serine hydrolase [Egibacter rhizosphaerae]|uniref:Class A beta-lactamase-related serine hydrolase n=1 Tax=Egibacter rhizosphaerae TaxID=1670831 RepID=A0A411YBZ9_9ACTN|nr:serine hydrolase domain-containing protein [Egibacter rhizosphaerae]QBI18705.1 class A beta-lactamase-related serine hydrolase [Egibacter rhizosphaerae]
MRSRPDGKVQTTTHFVLVSALMLTLAMGLTLARGSASDATAQDGADDPWDRAQEPVRSLRWGEPHQADLVAEHLDGAGAAIAAGTRSEPLAYPGGVGVVARNGVVALQEAHGKAVRFGDDPPTELPEDEQRDMTEDTIVDLASLTKLFTGIAVMQLVEEGALELDQPVAEVLPEFAEGGKDEVTVRHLLTHTGGLPAWLPLWSQYDSPDERMEAALTAEATAEPGTARTYSDLGFIALGALIEEETGQPLDRVIEERITSPLGMDDTGFNPDAELIDRIAATEHQPLAERGVVHGEVHDENAWSLGGVAGHAGLFSTAEDLAALAQTLLNGGRYADARILEASTVQTMMSEQLADIGEPGQALAFERGQRWLQDAMWSPDTVSHTGFTGTSLVIDPHADAFAVLVTNRVHPSRDGPSINPQRREFARAAARAVPVAPQTQNEAWYAGLGPEIDATLEVPLDLPEQGEATLDLDLWFELPDDGELRVEARSDGEWEPLPGTLRSGDAERSSDGVVEGSGERRWWDATFDLDAHRGATDLRLTMSADALAAGRGVYVDRARVDGPSGGPIFNDQNPHDQSRWEADGWIRASE